MKQRYCIYYRDLPYVLEKHLNKDIHIKYAKDGLKEFSDGHKCPRLSVTVEETGNVSEDKQRMRALEDLLDFLLSNNQIVGYS